MKMRTRENIRELRRILGQTQEVFAATIGASKDTVASWETGRNRLSEGMARRISLVTGVDDRSLMGGKGPLVTRHPFPRKPFTREEYDLHQKRFWEGAEEGKVRRQLGRCVEALELLLTAAVRVEEGMGAARLAGVLDAFNQWCEQAGEDFGLGEQIEAELAKRKQTLELNHSYAQWREMARTDPEMARKMGFKDDPKRDGKEMLKLTIETVPIWKPGWGMRRGEIVEG